MNNKISNSQLLKDIEVTQGESQAYKNIANGFGRLVVIHEKEGTRYASFCKKNQLEYEEKYAQCMILLSELHKIREQRGLR